MTTVTGERLPYDVLLVASGARPVEPFPRATAFTGSLTDQDRLHGIVQDVEEGYLRRLAFVVPEGSTWPLPLYELALMLAERAYSMCADLELHFVTPEATPLAIFGADAVARGRRAARRGRDLLHAAAPPRSSRPAGCGWRRAADRSTSSGSSRCRA